MSVQQLNCACCNCEACAATLPSVITVRWTAGGVTRCTNLPLGSTYFWSYSYFGDYCAVDGAHHYYFIVGIFCVAGKWTFGLTLRDSITDVSDQVVMNWNITLVNNSEYSVVCNPMHFRFAGTNGSVDPTYSGQTICGLLVPASGIHVLPSISADFSLVPCCCNWGSMPATATLSYILGSLSAASMNLLRITDGYGSTSPGFNCVVGDGTRIQIDFSVQCSAFGWNFSLNMLHIDITTGVILKSIVWGMSNIIPGMARPAGVAFSCSPFHVHFELLNTSGPATASTVTCGGVAYPFGPAGTINAILDVVTP